MSNEQRQKITRYGLGCAAAILAVYFLLTHIHEPVVFFASLFFLVICATDALYGKIHNITTLSLLIVGLWFNLRVGGLSGGALALAGMATGLLLLIVPYLMGGMGGGDLKALAALGSLLGPGPILQVFVIAALIGGAMGLLHLAVSDDPLQRLSRWWTNGWRLIKGVQPSMPGTQEPKATVKYSYGPAIAFGFFAFISWGGLL